MRPSRTTVRYREGPGGGARGCGLRAVKPTNHPSRNSAHPAKAATSLNSHRSFPLCLKLCNGMYPPCPCGRMILNFSTPSDEKTCELRPMVNGWLRPPPGEANSP
ncbi:hypothetical protein BAUCODRAFT_283852 [Baudoinia panamericana UAMH 10762]|uniref:Uncharacterized protein n=1 Tax=Baudoinia panamericana (strain UAMH 10762) TaxID=717646 RepID=M2LE61_BAUPA|nr:uncharacterized protein BAUCODRAFT_283852 [Baudoinia panamericana UAMH 10762]EMC92267.1 hypothetical protein BAUCODRAFT_283852 [Baudoinia panamericana UAMH 10762]